MPSVLWRCWLGGRKGIRPVKTEWWDVGMVIWDEVRTCVWPRRCHCHSLSLAPVNSDWFYLPGFYLSGTCSSGWSRRNSRRAVKRLCVFFSCNIFCDFGISINILCILRFLLLLCFITSVLAKRSCLGWMCPKLLILCQLCLTEPLMLLMLAYLCVPVQVR